jgi:hypothetical protein
MESAPRQRPVRRSASGAEFDSVLKATGGFENTVIGAV